MNTREFLKKSLILGAGVTVAPRILSARTTIEQSISSQAGMKSYLSSVPEFKQYSLNYAFDALEPYIDTRTMELHYSKHHAGYTGKFNAAIESEGISQDLQAIFAKVSAYSDAVRNNGGGFYNHNLYWQFMSPEGGGEPGGKIGSEIRKQFGSFSAFKEQFSNAAATHFGSGWAWLVLDKEGRLVITSTPNQDNPLMDVSEVRGEPLLNIDVWEHAYYLNYQNQRKRYIDAYWNIINWEFADRLYRKAAG